MRSASTRQSLRARPSTLCDPTSGFRILCIELGLVMGHSRGETLPRNVVKVDNQSSGQMKCYTPCVAAYSTSQDLGDQPKGRTVQHPSHQFGKKLAFPPLSIAAAFQTKGEVRSRS